MIDKDLISRSGYKSDLKIVKECRWNAMSGVVRVLIFLLSMALRSYLEITRRFQHEQPMVSITKAICEYLTHGPFLN